MLRRIIEIDENKCNGCGLCANACHEGAIDIVNGKAKLMREHYCDGLGDCLPVCPMNAISFVEREAPAYDEAAVLASKAVKNANVHESGCPGSRIREMNRKEQEQEVTVVSASNMVSQLSNWPVQIKLAPIKAPYFENAKLLIAADCTAYAYANFHQDYIRDKVTLIGCSKLDDMDYTEKLTEIIKQNSICEVTIVRMEVPCCGGLEHMVRTALQNSGKFIPWHVDIISIDGERM